MLFHVAGLDCLGSSWGSQPSFALSRSNPVAKGCNTRILMNRFFLEVNVVQQEVGIPDALVLLSL